MKKAHIAGVLILLVVLTLFEPCFGQRGGYYRGRGRRGRRRGRDHHHHHHHHDDYRRGGYRGYRGYRGGYRRGGGGGRGFYRGLRDAAAIGAAGLTAAALTRGITNTLYAPRVAYPATAVTYGSTGFYPPVSTGYISPYGGVGTGYVDPYRTGYSSSVYGTGGYVPGTRRVTTITETYPSTIY